MGTSVTNKKAIQYTFVQATNAVESLINHLRTENSTQLKPDQLSGFGLDGLLPLLNSNGYLTISNPYVEEIENGFKVSATFDLLELPSIQFVLTIVNQDNSYQFDLIAETTESISIANLNAQLAIQKIQISNHQASLIQTKLSSQETSIQLEASLESNTLDFSILAPIGIQQLDIFASIITGNSIAKSIPTEFNQLSSIQLSQFKLEANLSEKSLSALQFEISSTTPISLGNFQIIEPKLSCSFTKENKTAKIKSLVDLTGIVAIGKSQVTTQLSKDTAGSLVAKGSLVTPTSLKDLLLAITPNSFNLKGIPKITISTFNFSLASDSKKVDGTATVPDFGEMNFDLAIEGEGKTQTKKLEFNFKGSTPQLKGLPLSIQDFKISFEAAEKTTGAISGNVAVGNALFQVDAAYPLKGNQLTIQTTQSFAVPTIQELTQSLQLTSLTSSLPEELLILSTGLQIESFYLNYDFETSTVTKLNATIGIQKLDFLKSVSGLQNIKLSIESTSPFVSKQRKINFSLTSDLVTSKGSYPVSIVRTVGNEWIISVESNKIEFADLTSLGKFVGGSISSYFPKEFSFPKAIYISNPTLKIDGNKKAITDFDIKVYSTGSWDVIKGKVKLSDISWELNVSNVNDKNLRSVANSVQASTTLFGNTFTVEGNKTTDTPWTLTANLKEGTEVSIQELANNFISSNSAKDLPNLKFSQLELDIEIGTKYSIKAVSSKNWKIPVGQGIDVSDLGIEFERTLQNKKWTSTGTLFGALALGKTTVDLSLDFPGNIVLDAKITNLPLGQLLDGLNTKELFKGLEFPKEIRNITLDELDFNIDITNKSLSVMAKAPGIDSIELVVCKSPKKKWGVAMEITPSSSFNFSDIIPGFTELDGANLSSASLILSTLNSKIQFQSDPSGDLTLVKKGLNLKSDLSLKGTGADKILGIQELEVSAVIGTKPTNIQLISSIEGEIKIANGVELKNAQFILRPNPQNLSIVLQGTVQVTIKDDVLDFIGGIEIEMNGASFSATMLGKWNEPFGVKGISIEDIALELGISFQGVPSVGIAGSVDIGKLESSMAVKFDGANPAQSMILFALNQMSLQEIMQAFTSTKILDSIPKEASKTILNASVKDLEVYIAPMDTNIGALQFDQGISIKGDFNLWGLKGKVDLHADFSSGIQLYAELDAIKIGKIFQLTGVDGNSNPVINLDISPTKAPDILINGTVDLLGISRSTFIKINDKEFYIRLEGKLFNMITATVEASGGNFKSGGAIMVGASLTDTGFLKKIANEAANAINSAANAATSELRKAKRDVDDAQRKIDGLNNNINDRRAQVRRDRAAVTNTFNRAKSEVASAQNKVNSLNSTIRSKERQRNKEANKKISQRIWVAWKPTPTWSNPTKGKNIYTTISIPDPRGIAKAGVLQTEITALYVALGTSQALLKGAQATLSLAKKAVNLAPIDSDPAIIALFATKETASGILDAYKGTLSGIQAGIGGMANASNFILKNGLANLVQVRKASFKGSLSATSGGSISVAFDIMLLGNREKFSLKINLKDPAGAAKKIAEELVKKIG